MLFRTDARFDADDHRGIVARHFAGRDAYVGDRQWGDLRADVGSLPVPLKEPVGGALPIRVLFAKFICFNRWVV